MSLTFIHPLIYGLVINLLTHLESWGWVIKSFWVFFFWSTYYMPGTVFLWLQRWTWPNRCSQRTHLPEGETDTFRESHDTEVSELYLRAVKERQVLDEPVVGGVSRGITGFRLGDLCSHGPFRQWTHWEQRQVERCGAARGVRRSAFRHHWSMDDGVNIQRCAQNGSQGVSPRKLGHWVKSWDFISHKTWKPGWGLSQGMDIDTSSFLKGRVALKGSQSKERPKGGQGQWAG